MKKFLYALLVVTLLTVVCVNVAFAESGSDVIYSDLSVCINHYNIPSYLIDGQLVVAVDDLRAYGMEVSKLDSGEYCVFMSSWPKVNAVSYEVDVNKFGTVVGTAYKDVVPVFINYKRVKSYQLNGYTMIPAEELGVFGQAVWVDEQKVLKIWIDGLHVKNEYVSPYKEGLVYKETLEIANAYSAVNEYEKALSALDWTCNYGVSEESIYRAHLESLREEIAYITAIKNIDLAVQGGNLENAVWNARYYLILYCKYNSPYYNALATRYAELEFQNASNNIAVHLKNGDYYSAYITADYAKSSIYVYAYEGNGSDIYYEKINSDLIAISNAWRKAVGKSFVIAETNIYNNDDGYSCVNMHIINLSDKPVMAFKTESDICDVFGELLSHWTLYTEDTYLPAYGNDHYTWELTHRNAKKINNLKVTQVVYQ